MKIKLFSVNNKSEKTVEASDKIFAVVLNPNLISQDVQRILANKRNAIASTKDRGQVSGGGRKPFKQKGTGNARAGSNRSPLWRGGGITFGPDSSRNYQKRLPQKMRRKALLMILSEKLREKKLIVVEKIDFVKISTKLVQEFLEKMPIQEGKILIVLAKTNINLELSAANLPYLKVVTISGLNILDLMKYDYLLTDEEGVLAIEKQFGEKK